MLLHPNTRASATHVRDHPAGGGTPPSGSVVAKPALLPAPAQQPKGLGPGLLARPSSKVRALSRPGIFQPPGGTKALQTEQSCRFSEAAEREDEGFRTLGL